ncbi:RNA-dependent RNA polymerase, putative [Talaromyces stipitatus ATCC 10500]|uniref:RNA-dependent RNA polymerase n=1 Tax=Talaromyces stipitatus (strain ATCC 10500 / CBS 375.48 / QM 6759 / NRRL 1006) TaxID=441959 RepID=B8MKI2_TALSN|nr:RNA-dependent RNA polymerase, putative [Talaromyces stipitatus ATCC 10500]EED15337.1 RNA-dependent RNA polymerase, putative [Talaromyces stipitatus ATCC 10500]
MEVFCRNVPGQLKKRHLEQELRPILAELDIVSFECRVHSNGHATITIADVFKARRLLDRYPRVRKDPRQQLKIRGTNIFIEEGRNQPDPFLLQSLQEEDKERRSRPRRSNSISNDADSRGPRKFSIFNLSCGTFDFRGTSPVFIEQFEIHAASGTIHFGSNKLTITLPNPEDVSKNFKIESEYWSIYDAIYVSDQGHPTITFGCNYAPRLFEAPINNQMQTTLATFMRDRRAPPPREEKKTRIGFLNLSHKCIVSSCFVYRVTLINQQDFSSILRLSHNPNLPELVRWRELRVATHLSFTTQLTNFFSALRQGVFPFAVQFQLRMLVSNGELPPEKVISLFPYVRTLLARKRPLVVAKILKGLPRRLHHPDPHADSADVSLEAIIETLKEIEEMQALEYVQPGQPGYLHHNQMEIHRLSVTPTGIYLDGPNVEAENRVLRKYRHQSDYFIRVRFIEESGDPMMYDISSNLDRIFKDRFGEVLRDGVIIADRHYRFLGFSHSSLRSRSCWFMAEFHDSEGQLITVNSLISKLGDFSHIRSPAKFAARLGQTFSDTLTSISVDRDMVKRIDDVERNGRVFSDGCGTISKEVLWRIYRDYPRNAAVRPTVFQVRISGAKGMLSLDPRLKGPTICLRDSMIKFRAEADHNIEICGSGIHSLPCYLNAPLIKILEDLGVARDLFLELQREEVQNLRLAIRSPRQAASFLDQAHITKSTRLSWLITVLQSMGLNYNQDKFLKRAVELVILMKLRDLKYRARILVPEAVTLYGIMDETGYLQEGEIFVPILNEVTKRRNILVQNKVLITRSPAFHPGDVQMVNAVNVPEASPLRKLHNCVVFSQKGERDLPSQLSGGDLDGDIFNIIYDPRFRLQRLARPADYPRAPGTVLDRPVQMEDIQKFFIEFMQQDQLGRIATTHKILADQQAAGTFDPNCLTLAHLHSTAVDFSKTGTPVDIKQIPKYPPYRPDFMAPGPRVRVAESIEVLDDGREHIWDDGGSIIDDDDDVRPPLRYYKSQRVLGALYRTINERDFIRELEWDSPNHQQQKQSSKSVNVLAAVWEYVKCETAGFLWDHCVKDAYYIRDVYEDSIQDLMYQYSDAPWKTCLTEVEVFIGNIMGQNHKQTAYQKESSRAMRDAYDDLVKWTISLITGRGTENEGESLERSVACFWVALEDTRQKKSSVLPGQKKLDSYAWVAAVTCLHEIDKLQRSMPF